MTTPDTALAQLARGTDDIIKLEDLAARLSSCNNVVVYNVVV